MQSHNGEGTCNSNLRDKETDNSKIKDPCPKSTIQKMIAEGAGGTSSGDGLAKLIDDAKGSDAKTYYRAARMYNSGSTSLSGDLVSGGSTACYAADIANRLTGWVKADTKCTED